MPGRGQRGGAAHRLLQDFLLVLDLFGDFRRRARDSAHGGAGGLFRSAGHSARRGDASVTPRRPPRVAHRLKLCGGDRGAAAQDDLGAGGGANRDRAGDDEIARLVGAGTELDRRPGGRDGDGLLECHRLARCSGGSRDPGGGDANEPGTCTCYRSGRADRCGGLTTRRDKQDCSGDEGR